MSVSLTENIFTPFFKDITWEFIVTDKIKDLTLEIEQGSVFYELSSYFSQEKT